uniref:Uncharacterized protein n=1 Tax=Aegilops tauschii subsp. strangulata TaxID=200361 RepID=A0A453B466_AEGTS
MASIISSTSFRRAKGHQSPTVTKLHYLLFQASICSMKSSKARITYSAQMLMSYKQ